jgi:hypothetical protein
MSKFTAGVAIAFLIHFDAFLVFPPLQFAQLIPLHRTSEM